MEIKRQQIEHLFGEEIAFSGKFVKYGSKRGTDIDGTTSVTMLFSNVHVNGIYIDHMWVGDSKRTRKLNIKEGSIVKFTGIVGLYHRGNGYAIDKKRNIEIIKEGKGRDLHKYLITHSSFIKFSATYQRIMYELQLV